MKLIIYPYNMISGSARQLKEALHEFKPLRVFPNGRYKYKEGHVVLNWGSGTVPIWDNNSVMWFNHPTNVLTATNKLRAFEEMSGVVSIPQYTTNKAEAEGWVEQEETVVCRALLRGHSGEGIYLWSKDLPHPQAYIPLYVKYKKKAAEYRIHIFKDKVLDIQQKRREREVERGEFENKIRNRGNGWVFCRNDVSPPGDVLNQARLAVEVLGLSFGAVDVIWNEREQKAYVLEVNTAPGLEGTTLDLYVGAIAVEVRQ